MTANAPKCTFINPSLPLQAKVSDWKFTYFLRRYVANEPSEAVMLRSARRCAELTHAALPEALLRRGDALGQAPEALKEIVDLGAVLEEGESCLAAWSYLLLSRRQLP